MNNNTLAQKILIPKGVEMFKSNGSKTEYLVPVFEIIIGIGKDHSAKLLIDEESYEALLNGAPLHFTTGSSNVE